MLFHPYLLLLKELLRKLELNRIENDVQFILMPGHQRILQRATLSMYLPIAPLCWLSSIYPIPRFPSAAFH